MIDNKPIRFLRTCQECGHKQVSKPPDTYKDTQKEAWRDVKCRKCTSIALDYGSWIARDQVK